MKPRHPPRPDHHHPRSHQHQPGGRRATRTCAARAQLPLSLAPTTTGSATAIALIYPELKGSSMATRPRLVLNARSPTACSNSARPRWRRNVLSPIRGGRPACRHPRLRGRPLSKIDYKRHAQRHRRRAVDHGDRRHAARKSTPGTTTRWATPAARWIWPATWKASALNHERSPHALRSLPPRASIPPSAAWRRPATRRARLRYIVTAAYWALPLTDGAAHAGAAAFLSPATRCCPRSSPVPGSTRRPVLANLVGGWLATQHVCIARICWRPVTQILGFGLRPRSTPDDSNDGGGLVVVAQGICGVAKDLTQDASRRIAFHQGPVPG